MLDWPSFIGIDYHTNIITELLRGSEPLLLLPFAGEAAEHYADIRSLPQKQGNPIGPNDLVIAATARVHGLPLATRNSAEFSRVPLLRVESW